MVFGRESETKKEIKRESEQGREGEREKVEDPRMMLQVQFPGSIQ